MAESRKNDPVTAALDRTTQLEDRPWHIFVLPPEEAAAVLPGGEPIRSLALVELSPHELRQVIRASADTTAVAETQVMYALRAINVDADGNGGKKLSVADGSADKTVATMHPKVLGLAMAAYNHLHENTAKVERDFLKTRKVIVRS